jgi:phosphoribosyl 1,2-cyclic phosphate phosphodiesterase
MRLRCSAYVQAGDTALVIDTGPEFRLQALKYNIKHLDAVLVTHSHADHLNGLDDIRIFSHTASPGKDNRTENVLPLYANGATLRDIQIRFSYVFAQTQQGGGKPLLNLFNADEYTKENPVVVRHSCEGGASVATKSMCAPQTETGETREVHENSCNPELLCFPLPMKHGTLDVIGWNIRERAPNSSSAPNSQNSNSAPNSTAQDAPAAGKTEESAPDGDSTPDAAAPKLLPADNSVASATAAEKADKAAAQTHSAQKSFTYLTDCSEVPDETIQLIQGTEHLVIDGLRETEHPTHFSFLEALECAARIHPKNVWLTHICHNSSHEQINAWLAIHKKQFPELADIPVHAAYDGLKLTI